MNFLVVWHKPTLTRWVLLPIYDEDARLLAAVELFERHYRSNKDVEVVFFTTDSLDSLKNTHSKYFTREELAKREEGSR